MTNDASEIGRRLVFRVAVIAVAISILTIVTFNIVQGPGRLPQQVVRLGFTIALCFFLVRGRSWARWISVALFLIAGIGSVAGSVSLMGQSTGAWPLLAMGAAYFYCAAVLVASSSVKTFFSGPVAPIQASDQGA